jgi:hypothetical protein
MNELDELWAQKLAEAAENARVSGRHDIADYLELKAANDAIRRTAIGWLVDSMIQIAAEANRTFSGIAIEREDPYNFSLRGANLVGSMLRVRQGVRCMTLEAGWTRTPADGFIRGGALAVARIVHFGMPKANAELALIKRAETPAWMRVGEDNKMTEFHSDGLLEHFRVFHGI